MGKKKKRYNSNSKKPNTKVNAPKTETVEEQAPVVNDEYSEPMPEETAQKPSSKPTNVWMQKVPPVIGYSVFFGVLAVAVAIGLLVCLL